jgi:CheY-like chemotaxis protein
VKILVVDDEPLLVMTAAEILTDLGHTAIEARSGKEALALLQEHGDIALMITDHSMPAMTGAELVRQAVTLRPDLKVLLASGYDHLPEAPGVKIDRLPKPYFEADLIAAIARVTGTER